MKQVVNPTYKISKEKLRHASPELIEQLLQNESVSKGSLFKIELSKLAYPIWLRAQTSDIPVFEQIFLDEDLNVNFGNGLSFIIDAGANIGLSAIYLANNYPESTIVALEVEESNFELLKKNTAFYSKIIPLFKGLWNKKTFLSIDNPQEESWSFTVSEAQEKDDKSIEGIGVLDLLKEYDFKKIDLLKIDIEGAELEVLSNSHTWIDNVNTIALEVHKRAGCWESFLSFIEKNRLSLVWSGEYAVLNRKKYSR